MTRQQFSHSFRRLLRLAALAALAAAALASLANGRRAAASSFDPPRLEVPARATVSWFNRDEKVHTVTPPPLRSLVVFNARLSAA